MNITLSISCLVMIWPSLCPLPPQEFRRLSLPRYVQMCTKFGDSLDGSRSAAHLHAQANEGGM